MSFYRTFMAAVAALGLASVAFAADNTTNTAKQPSTVKVVKTATKTTTTENTTQTEKLNINKATAKELSAVKGLNATRARSIVSWRKKNGDFKSVEDLKQVRGFKRMNEQTLKEIEDRLTVS